MVPSSKTTPPLISVHAASGIEYCEESKRVLLARDKTKRKEAWYGRLCRSGNTPRSIVFDRVVKGSEWPRILDELPLAPCFECRVEKTDVDWKPKYLYPVALDLYKEIFGGDLKASNNLKPPQPDTLEETDDAEESKGRKGIKRSPFEAAGGRKKLCMSKPRTQVDPQSMMQECVDDIVKASLEECMACYDRTGCFTLDMLDVDTRKVEKTFDERMMDIMEVCKGYGWP